MPNFATSSATVRTSSLESTVNQISRNGRSDVLQSDQGIPPPIIHSMDLQGMMNQNAWGPGPPINPNEPIGSEPRQFEYMIGQNIVQRPRSTENVTFDTLRSIIEIYDVAQMAIEVRQDELRNLDWDIVPDEEEDAKKYESEIKQIRSFFMKPDGHMLFDDFQNQLAYDWLAYDALTIYPRLTKGGKLGALEPVDGTTITPMIDYYGRIPEAPAPAYVQWVNGMPWVWLNRDQLLYCPHKKRTNKLYGYPALEYMLNNVNTDVRFQLYFLHYFTDGSIPETWINAPEGVSDPKQIKELQTMYDAVLVGDQRQKHRARFIPAGAKVQNAKNTTFDIAAAQYFLTKTCAGFKVTPAELGFTEKVNKSSGESQENVQYRRSIKPSASFFSKIYTGIIHKYFGLPNLQFKFLNLEEQEDLLVQAQTDDIYIKNGTISPDELRVKRFGLDIDQKQPVPRMVFTGSSVMALSDAIAQSAATVQATQNLAAQPQQTPAATAENDQPVDDKKPPDDAQKAAHDFFVRARGIQTPKSSNG